MATVTQIDASVTRLEPGTLVTTTYDGVVAAQTGSYAWRVGFLTVVLNPSQVTELGLSRKTPKAEIQEHLPSGITVISVYTGILDPLETVSLGINVNSVLVSEIIPGFVEGTYPFTLDTPLADGDEVFVGSLSDYANAAGSDSNTVTAHATTAPTVTSPILVTATSVEVTNNDAAEVDIEVFVDTVSVGIISAVAPSGADSLTGLTALTLSQSVTAVATVTSGFKGPSAASTPVLVTA